MKAVCSKMIYTALIISLAHLTVSQVNAHTPDSTRIVSFENDNDSLPVVSPYFFEHQYLSVVAPNISEDDGYILENPEILNTYSPEGNGFKSPFKDEDIKVTKIMDSDTSKFVYIWEFPEPKHLREAKYIGFFPYEGAYRAVAICIGSMVDWEISISEASMRHTYGRVKLPTNADECFEILKGRNAFGETIVPGDFLQEGYTAPPYSWDSE